MFSGLTRYLQLTVKSKTGISSGVIIFAMIALIGAIIAFAFAILALFIWLAERYSALTAALVLTGLFLLLAILGGIIALIMHKRIIADANRALQARANSPWLDPKMLPIGMTVLRSIGLRRIAPMLAVGFLVAALAKEWFGNGQNAGEEQSPADENGES